jgi:uncharacterized protein involved in propanediol utilization
MISLKKMVGTGRSFGSFGEIVQGRLTNGEDFLVTLPVDLWSESKITCRKIDGPLVVESDYEKTKALVSLLLEEMGIRDEYYLNIEIDRKIPVGKGLSSSTADMLAALRAIEQVFDLTLSRHEISRLFSLVEPHDALHYDTCVVYNHRRGYSIKEFLGVPEFQIIAVDNGGQVDTIEYNRRVQFTSEHLKLYDALLADLIVAFESRDLRSIAHCATRSTFLHASRVDNKILSRAVECSSQYQALGTIAAHSGTVFGYLYPKQFAKSDLSNIAHQIQQDFKKEIFLTKTVSGKELV